MYFNRPNSPKREEMPSSPSKLIKKTRVYHPPLTFSSLLLPNDDEALIPTKVGLGYSEVIITPTEEDINQPEESRNSSVTCGVEIFDTDDTLTDIPENLTDNFEEEDSFSSTSNDSDLDSDKYNVRQKHLLRP